MKIEDLAPEVRSKLGRVRYDHFVGKHEGPWEYESWPGQEELEFLSAAGLWILLPIDRDNHSNITFERVIASQDAQTLTIFLRDTTFVDSPSDSLDGYFLAV